jgi:hypothetical protein
MSSLWSLWFYFETFNCFFASIQKNDRSIIPDQKKSVDVALGENNINNS